LRRKKEEERNGGEVAEKRETEKKEKKNFGQNSIVSLYVNSLKMITVQIHFIFII